MLDPEYLDWLSGIDRQIVTASKDIKVLSRLSWPVEVQRKFLDEVSRGQLTLPDPVYAPVDLGRNRKKLQELIRELEGDNEPLRRYLRDTARSYLTLCELLESINTPSFTALSIKLYGSPTDHISSGHVNNLEAARHFLDVSREYRMDTGLHEADYCLTAEQLASEMQPELGNHGSIGSLSSCVREHVFRNTISVSFCSTKGLSTV